MNTTKTLILAAMTVLAVGVGTAMAQDGGGATSDYWAARQQAAARQAAASVNQNAASTQESTAQYGSSDRALPPGPRFDSSDGVAGGF